MEVELIDSVDKGEQIKKMYQYLDVKKITDLQEIKSFYSDLFTSAPPDALEKEISGWSIKNPFETWLDAKINSLIRDGVGIDTPEKYVSNFYYKDKVK